MKKRKKPMAIGKTQKTMANNAILGEKIPSNPEEVKRLFYEGMRLLSNQDRRTLKSYKLCEYMSGLLVRNNETRYYYTAYNPFDLWLQYDAFYDEYDDSFIMDVISDLEGGEESTILDLCFEWTDLFRTNDTIWYEQLV